MCVCVCAGCFWGGGARGQFAPPPQVALPPLRWGMINSLYFQVTPPQFYEVPDSPPENVCVHLHLSSPIDQPRRYHSFGVVIVMHERCGNKRSIIPKSVRHGLYKLTFGTNLPICLHYTRLLKCVHSYDAALFRKIGEGVALG